MKTVTLTLSADSPDSAVTLTESFEYGTKWSELIPMFNRFLAAQGYVNAGNQFVVARELAAQSPVIR
jgi:hypothetical protein